VVLAKSGTTTPSSLAAAMLDKRLSGNRLKIPNARALIVKGLQSSVVGRLCCVRILQIDLRRSLALSARIPRPADHAGNCRALHGGLLVDRTRSSGYWRVEHGMANSITAILRG
jgi:hypothetical protein